jgi:hypothetical protein
MEVVVMRKRMFVWSIVAIAAVGLASLAAITQARVGHRVSCAPAKPLRHRLEPPTTRSAPPSRSSSQDTAEATFDEREHNESAAINDILEIRRRQGAELFDDALLDSVLAGDSGLSADSASEIRTDDFSAALRRVAATSAADASVTDAARLEVCQQQYERSLRLGDDHEMIAALRAAGRHLDRRADELEVDQQFQHADRLRRLAHRLRQEARVVDGEN